MLPQLTVMPMVLVPYGTTDFALFFGINFLL